MDYFKKWSDIKQIIEEPYHEGLTLDFKEKIPSKDDKKGWERIYACICAFANAEGGTLIFGIKEKGGNATELCPIPFDDFEGMKIKFLQKIRIYITPMPIIKFFQIQKHESDSDEGCLLVQIPKSFSGPHMTSNHANLNPERQCRFYKRIENSAIVMTYKEIREHFIMSQHWEELAQKFIDSRREQILCRECPFNFDEPPYIHFCLIPLGKEDEKVSFTEEFLSDLRQIVKSKPFKLDYDRPSFEGHSFYAFTPDESRTTTKLLNIFYNGSIEIIFSKTCIAWDETHINQRKIEREIVILCFKLFELFEIFFSIFPPFAVFYNFYKVKGMQLSMQDESQKKYRAETSGTNINFCKHELSSKVYIDQEFSSEATTGDILKPIFNRFWRSVGESGSPNYDPTTGKWK